MSAAQLLERLRLAGVDLWAEGDRLRYSAPDDGLTDELIAELRRLKPDILRLIAQSRLRHEPREPAAPVPLSFAQEGFWLLDRLYPGHTGGNEQFAIRLGGPLDGDRLRRAWRDLVGNHEALRAVFGERDGEPFQRFDGKVAEIPPPFTVTDLPALATAELRRPFDLGAGPLLRPVLVCRGEEDHLLLVTAHHIVADGLCVPLIRDELAARYAGGPAADCAPDAPRYGDFARWQRENLGPARLAPLLAWWRARLEGVAPAHALPMAGPRALAQGPARRIAFVIPAATVVRLRALARAEHVTLFTLLFAAFRLLLQRYGAGDDLALAAPVTLRDEAATRNLIGCMVNTVLCRTRVASGGRFRELLAAERRTLIEVLGHRQAPLDRVVESVTSFRRRGEQPLSQLLFQFDSAVPDVSSHGLDFGVEAVLADRASYWDLEWALGDTGEGMPITGHVTFQCELFDEWFIRQMTAGFAVLLDGIAQDPSRSVGTLDILPAALRQRVLVAWNATAAPYPDGTLHSLALARLWSRPDAVALRAGGAAITGRELAERSSALAAALARHGVGAGDCVGVALAPSFDLVAGLLAVLRLGAACVPLDPSYPAARLAHIIADARPAALLVDNAGMADLAPAGVPVVFPSAVATPGHPMGDAVPDAAGHPDDVAWILYTSGSTGAPKGAVGRHRGAVNRCHWMWREFAFGAGEVFCLRTSINFVDSAWEIFGALIHGVPLEIIPAAAASDPALLVPALAAGGVTHLVLVPGLLRALLEALPDPPARLPALASIITSGEPLDPQLWQEVRRRWPRLRLLNTYGTSEIWDATCCDTTALAGAPARMPIGRPIANVRTYVLDAQLQPLPPGVSGELCVGGVGAGGGYWQQPALTAERFVTDPFDATPGARLYRTGDLARWLPDGSLECLGRADAQVKLRGFRIEPAEIEAALRRQPGVGSAAAALRTDERGNAALLAWFTGDADAATLGPALARELPVYMVPSRFIRLDRLPLTPSGKLDRRELPVPAATAVAGEPPRTPLERDIAALWCDLLGLGTVDRDADFFSQGGHSLLAIRFLARLNASQGSALTLQEFFAGPTVAGAAAALTAFRARRTGGAGYAAGVPAAPVADDTELSFGQERLWFLDQLDPASPAYNIAWVVELHGPLDVAALRRALDHLPRRHPSLRLTFDSVAGRPRVREVADAGVPLVVVAAPDEPAREELRRQFAREPFDISRGPLLRAALLTVDAGRADLILVLHHMITDGTSNAVLFADLAGALATALRGEEPVLAPAGVSYADFVRWQRAEAGSEPGRAALSWWVQRLAGAPPALQLPLDKPRPADQKFHGAWIWRSLPPALLSGLRELARQHRSSLYMVLLAAFKTLLHRFTGETDLLVGTPVSGRPREEFADLVGLFINTTVLRTTARGDMPFTAYLADVRSCVLDALAHQQVPFEHVVEVLQPVRTLSAAPVFQVMFNLVPIPARSRRAGPVELRLGPLLDHGVSTFDLSLTAGESAAGLDLIFEFDTELFAAATVDAWADCFIALLGDVVARPRTPLQALNLLPPATSQNLHQRLAAVPADAPPFASVPELFHRCARERGDAAAVIAGGATLSYRELAVRARDVAAALAACGIGRGGRVAVCLPRSTDTVAAMLGVLGSGAACVPLDPDYPPARLGVLLQDADVAAVICGDAIPARVAGTAAVIAMHGIPRAADAADIVAVPLADDPAYLVYTSGTTGEPKGVVVTHASLANAFAGWQCEYGLLPDDVHLQMASQAFDVFTGDWVRALLSGGCLVLCPRETLLDPPALFALLHARHVTVAEFVPAVMRQLMGWLGEQGRDLSFMRLVVVGSDVWKLAEHRALVRLCGPRTRVVNSYGVAEATIDSTYFEGDAPAVSGGHSLIGRPFPGVDLAVLDAGGCEVAVGIVGELWIGGAGVAQGYWRRAGLTAERFVVRGDGQRWYRSGDRVRLRSDGELEYLGRADEQVKVRGYRVEPGEVEAAVNGYPGVSRCAVVVRGAGTAQAALWCYAVAAPGATLSWAALRGELQGRLPGYLVPAGLTVLGELPLTANGKVDRRALATRASQEAPVTELAERAGRDGYVAPRSGVEELLCGLFAEVLGHPVGVHDDFFMSGGHSLLATRLIARLRSVLEVELPLKALFEGPTVAQLAGRLASAPAPGGPRLTAAADAPLRGPVSYMQQRLWFLEQLEPGLSAYHLQVAWRLRGTLDLPALQRAVAALVARQEALRTRFVSGEDGEPLQEVIGQLAVPVVVEAAQDLDEGQLRERLAALAGAGFDLSCGPLLRVHLLQRGAQEQVLLIVLHHLIADGWSLAVLMRELSAFYNAARCGEPLQLPALPVRYRDYARWQRQWLQGEELQRQLRYWREELAGAAVVMNLPLDRPRLPVQRHRGAWLSRRVDERVTGALRRLAGEQQCTLYMVLLGAFAVVLSRYTGDEDLTVGTPVAGRERSELEGLIGFFINTLVLRVRLAGNPTFTQLLQRVRHTALQAYAHPSIPFERLVEALQPVRNRAWQPLTQVFFNFHSGPRALPVFAGLAPQLEIVEGDGAKFDLSLHVAEEDGGLAIAWAFDTDLFDEATVSGIAAAFTLVLEQLGAGPDMPVADISLQPPREPQPPPHMEFSIQPLLGTFLAHACRDGSALAVDDGECRLSYGELLVAAQGVSGAVGDLCAARGGRVGLLLGHDAGMVTGLLGVLGAGQAYVPLDPLAPAARQQQLLQDAGVQVLVTDEAHRQSAGWLRESALPVVTLEQCRGHSGDFVAASNEALAYVLYTSGSTGRPKGVMQSRGNVAAQVRTWSRTLGLSAADRLSLLSGYGYDAAVQDLFGALLNGASVHPLRIRGELGATALVDHIAAAKLTVLHATPTVYRYLFGGRVTCRQDLTAVRLVVLGGEAARRADLELFKVRFARGARFINGLGLTESTMALQFHADHDTRVLGQGLPVGLPVGELEIGLLDDAGEPHPWRGELVLKGPHLALGYLNDEAQSRARFGQDPDHPGWRTCRTGDILRRLPDGSYLHEGRCDAQLKLRGIRIEPAEVEAALRSYPGVQEAAVIPLPDHDGGVALGAFVGGPAESAVPSLRRHLHELLPAALVPAVIRCMPELPRWPNGKLDIARLAQTGTSASFPGPLHTAEEEHIARLWGELLPGCSFRRDDDFFASGGHSLLALRLVARLRDAFRREIPVGVIFAHPTIAGLAAWLAAAPGSGGGEIPAIPRAARRPAPSAGGDSP